MKLTVTLELEFIGGRRTFDPKELLLEICYGAQSALMDVTASPQCSGNVVSHEFTERPSRRVGG